MKTTADLFSIRPTSTEGLVKVAISFLGEHPMFTPQHSDGLRRIEEDYLILWDEGPSYDEDGSLYYDAWSRAFL